MIVGLCGGLVKWARARYTLEYPWCANLGRRARRWRNAVIRSLKENDIPEAQRILRLAFGTFLGLPNPEDFAADMDYVATRLRADASSAFAAEIDGKLVGTNFVTRWGSVGFFGPLTVHPDYWNRSVGQQLMQPVMECFERWKVTHAGLFTFPESPKHIALYQRYGFNPRFLTAILTKQIDRQANSEQLSRFSDSPSGNHDAVVQACYRLTNSLYPGLDVEREIRAVHNQNLGDTVLVWNGTELAGFAVCHCGPGTEAGSNKCYIKFAAAAPGPESDAYFDQLLDACETLAAARGLMQIEAGVNLGRPEAYHQMLRRGFRLGRPGVAMHRPNEPGYSRPGILVIDDWR
jgi:GNAT superfamily N-acetyltransferase